MKYLEEGWKLLRVLAETMKNLAARSEEVLGAQRKSSDWLRRLPLVCLLITTLFAPNTQFLVPG